MSEPAGDSYTALHILVPSRPAADNPSVRPRNVARLARAIVETAEHPERITLVLRLDDNAVLTTGEFIEAVLGQARQGAQLPCRIDVVTGPQTGLARSWTELAERAGSSADAPSHIALWGDDVVPETKGWDAVLAAALQQTRGIGFAYCRDGVWDHTLDETIPGHLDLPTAVVTTPRTMQLAGPIPVRHLFTDNWWRDLGWAAGVLHYRSGHMIRHHHPISHTARSMWDDTYRAANSEHRKLEEAAAYQEWAASPAADQAIIRLRKAAGLPTYD